VSPPSKIPVAQLQYLFDTYIAPSIDAGQCLMAIKSSNPAPPSRNAAPGTMSEMSEVHLVRHGNLVLVARCHCYRLKDDSMLAPWDPPDTTANGHGQLDPKWLFIHRVIYMPELPAQGDDPHESS
jgi:hypothetical protein